MSYKVSVFLLLISISKCATSIDGTSIEVLFHFCQATNISLKEFFDEDLKYPAQYQALIPYMCDLNQDELQDIIAIIKRIVKNKK